MDAYMVRKATGGRGVVGVAFGLNDGRGVGRAVIACVEIRIMRKLKTHKVCLNKLISNRN